MTDSSHLSGTRRGAGLFCAALAAILFSGAPVAARPAAAAASKPASPYVEGERVVFGGLGLGSVYGVYGSTTLPPLFAGYDQGLNKNISVGGVVGYSKSEYDYGWSSNEEYSYFMLGARGAYHFTDIFKDAPRFDPYGGAMLGYNIVSVSDGGGSASGSYILLGLYIGGRYWFNPNLAAHCELGFGMGVLNIGLAYKL